MKILLIFPAIAFFISFLSGCSAFSSSSASKLDSIFPQQIGQFNRVNANENSASWSTADYSKTDAAIFYGYGTENIPAAAQEKVKRKNFCNDEYLRKPITLKEEILRDKTGKEIGNVLICREPIIESSKVIGDKFTMTLANGNNYSVLQTNRGGLANLVEFAQALPANSQIDFAALKLDELIAANPVENYSIESLMKDFPLKLTDTPYLKGKILIVQQSPTNYNSGNGIPSISNSSEIYGLTKEMMTESISQAGTVVRVVCQKGRQIDFYVIDDAEKTKIPAYAVDCTVSIIDQSIPATIAQKKIVGDSLMQTESVTKTTRPNIQNGSITNMETTIRQKEFFASLPYEKIADYLKKMPKK